MRLLLTVWIVLGILFAESLAFGTGIDHGNAGGGSVVCRNGQDIISVELLDLYEQRELLQLTYDLGPSTLTYLQKVHYVLDRHKNMAPFRTKLWGEWADTFEREAVFLTGKKFNPVNDTGDIFPPNNCAFEQAAVQKTPIFPRDKRYIINNDLWVEMDEGNRAALVLHELIYREARTYGHEDSIRTRYLNAIWTAAGEMVEFSSWKSINELLANAHFKAGEAYGCAPVLFHVRNWEPMNNEFYQNGGIKRMDEWFYDLEGQVPTPFGNLSIPCVMRQNGRDTRIEMTEDGFILYGDYASGALKGTEFEIQLDKLESRYWVGSEQPNLQEKLIFIRDVSGHARCKGVDLEFKDHNGWLSIDPKTLKIRDCGIKP